MLQPDLSLKTYRLSATQANQELKKPLLQILWFFEQFTKPFNNMWTLKFKDSNIMLPSITPLRKQQCLAQQGQKVMSVYCYWQILIHFIGFCIFVPSQLLL